MPPKKLIEKTPADDVEEQEENEPEEAEVAEEEISEEEEEPELPKKKAVKKTGIILRSKPAEVNSVAEGRC